MNGKKTSNASVYLRSWAILGIIGILTNVPKDSNLLGWIITIPVVALATAALAVIPMVVFSLIRGSNAGQAIVLYLLSSAVGAVLCVAIFDPSGITPQWSIGFWGFIATTFFWGLGYLIIRAAKWFI
ncbi:MAG TPA: hypothetical protein VLH19_01075 [Patescibacteria group bacterium]|nr:hypothetical protein [Patescibacteria group bacterium]